MPPKLTQPLRPAARYRPGKAPVPVADDSDYSDQEEQEAQGTAADDGDDDDDDDQQVTEFRTTTTAGKPKGTAALNVALKQVEVDQTGKVKVGGRDEVGRTEMESSEGEYETDSEEEQEDKAPAKPESSEYETDSEEESDEEEEPLKPIYKPVFVSKRNRDTIAERQKELDPEALEAKREEEDRKRREEAKALVADSIVREIASKEAQEVHPDVDDTDGLDPEGEFEAWKLRELTRLKRDREARYALEKIREEVEARRALPEELRIKEDTERAEKSRKEKQRGQQAFLQKYHHKGVFHQDMDILKKHDYTAPTESTITDVSSLPAVMQKRNFGKAHQTKYTHLAAEDTSRQSGGWGRPGGTGGSGSGSGAGAGCFVCGGPHKEEEEETFRPPREEEQEDPPSREPTPALELATLVGGHVVRRLQPGRTTDQQQQQERRPPVVAVDEAGSASTAGDVTAIATEGLMTATATVGRMTTTTTLEIGAIEEDDAIRGTETGVGVGVRLVIGEDTTTTVAELTRGGGNRRLELLTIAGEAGRGVLLLFLLLMRDGEATTAIAMSPDAEEAAAAATVTVTGEGETIDQPNERGTISVAGSIDSRLKQVTE
ncbi:hypothetical protein B0A53_03787 [Rhodotorula sp. CCFEE 5036]|nr:hypothetical protein B0A53_03787 [Rhodotorula sp. CCFEE 5036]